LKSGNNAPISNNITHLIPFLGPLHVSLNSRESVFLVFWSFFNQLYLAIFDAKKKLAAKPKPWRINLLMYLANSGWKLIKNIVIARFGNTKLTGYRAFFDLLDNLVPATLDIYTVLFRNNKFDEYVDTIFRLWCMMRRFQRHNYDKILLAFLSDVYYWKSINHPIIETLKNNLNMFDEYVIENFHRLL